MTSQDKQRMLELCQRIMVEEKYSQMIRLVRELNDIFDANARQPRPATGASIASPHARREPERVNRGD